MHSIYAGSWCITHAEELLKHTSTYPERSPQRFDISLVHFADARQGGTKHGMVVLVDTLLDEVWRLVLKLLVG